MRTVSWSINAGDQFDLWIDHLIDRAGDVVGGRAKADVTQRVGRLDSRALMYRSSRLWPGLYEMSLHPWRKLVLYSVEGDRVEIIAFYDMRQDLSAVNPLSE